MASYVRTQRQDVLARNLIIQAEKIMPGHQLVATAMNKIYREACANVSSDQIPIDTSLLDELSTSNKDRAISADSMTEQLHALKIAYQHLLRVNPSDSTVKFRLAMAYELDGKRDEAIAIVTRLAPEESTKFMPAHACQALYLQAANRRDASSLLQLQHHIQSSIDWIEMDPRIISQTSCFFADCGQLSIALELAKVASQKSPKFAYRASKILVQLGRKDESNRELQRAISWLDSLEDQSPNLPRFFELQAWCYQQVGNTNRVREVLRKGVKFAGSDPGPLSELLANDLLRDLDVSIEERTRNWKQLAATLEECAELAPKNTKLGEYVSEALFEGLKAPEKAQAALKQQLQNDAASAKTYLILARTLAKRNRTKEALVQMKKSVERDPKNAEAWTYCAMLQFRNDPNDLSSAIESVQKALANGGNSADLHEIAGEIAMREGDWSSAVASWEKSLTIDPMRSDLRNRVVHAYATVGNYDAVERHRQAKQKLTPQEVPEGPVAIREKTPQ